MSLVVSRFVPRRIISKNMAADLIRPPSGRELCRGRGVDCTAGWSSPDTLTIRQFALASPQRAPGHFLSPFALGRSAGTALDLHTAATGGAAVLQSGSAGLGSYQAGNLRPAFSE